MSEKTQQNVLTASIQATADLNDVYKFVGLDGKYAGAGGASIGVLQAATKSGQWAPVMTYGIALVIVGAGGLTAGAMVASDATGQAVVGTVGALLGMSLEAVAAGGYARIVLGNTYNTIGVS